MLDGVDAVRAAVGTHLGYSDWLEIDQDRVNTFADATGDHQWIHVDPERAKDGPFGAAIAHGYLTMSLSNYFMPQIVETRGFSAGINYGVDKVRFPSPVKVGAVDPGRGRDDRGHRGQGRHPDPRAHHHRDPGRRASGLRHRLHQPLAVLSRR